MLRSRGFVLGPRCVLRSLRRAWVVVGALVLMAFLGAGPATAASEDSIIVDPVGAAGAWTPGGAVTFMNGTSMALVATSDSQMPVQLAVAGPCVLVGGRITAQSGAGSCTLTALTRPGNGYGGASNTYRILLAPGWQTAPLDAPASGSLTPGTRVRLGRPGLVTTAGQTVAWRVTKGRGSCKVVRTATGATRLLVGRAGSCYVRASAPAVEGQWQAYAVFRAYVIG